MTDATPLPASLAEIDRYAADVAATRARAMATLDTLQQRLEPGALIGNFAETAMLSMIGPSTAILGVARRTITRHPLVVAMAGLALGLTLFGRSKLAHAKVDVGGDYEAYSDFEDDYSANTGMQGLAALGDIEDRPLAAVLTGLAAGALIGALFPGTESENKLLGGARDRLSRATQAALQAARSELGSKR